MKDLYKLELTIWLDPKAKSKKVNKLIDRLFDVAHESKIVDGCASTVHREEDIKDETISNRSSD